ncbi:ubiquitin carboxyl-terminal hydrolase 2-like [Oryza brachyantha]|uniref:Ubiquitinyl hydrolase 1 n=1 Tax=Oryza brachyantha TaxID=4533 RepID=J3MUL9_ORYBR|nr:ubiquitin carboxyl-terminal hydrolase 2-like [Oryza brachyantha]
MEVPADPGRGDTAPPEVSKPKEKAAAPTSNTETGMCAHFQSFEEDMVMFISRLRSSERAPRCEHGLCENKVEKSSILVCLDCSSYLCIGDGTRNKPQGHARRHADLRQHCVAAFFSEPETLYCFTCERRLELDVSDMESDSDISSESGGCKHFLLDEEELTLIVSEISASKNVPACQHPECKITGKTHIMVCTGCNKHFCTRAEAKERPFGHARQHAKHCGHWVGLWYSDPHTMYCFTCEFDLALAAPNAEAGMVFGKEAFGQASGLVKEHVCPIRGMPNLGNTCYVNALLQCLFVLRKLRARMLAPDVPSDMLGVTLKELFEEVNNVDNARLLLNPMKFLTCVRILDARFVGIDMQDSHELLCFILDRLDKEEKLQMPAVAPTLVESIFSGEMSVAVSCRHCSYTSASSHEVIYDISAPLPSEMPPPKSIALPPRNISCMSREKTVIKLFPQVDMSNIEIVQAIAQGSDSHITGLELGDVAIEKICEPLDVDSIEVEKRSQSKDAVHVPSQTQKGNVPGEIVQLPTMADDLGQNDNAGLDNTSSELEVSMEAKKNTCSVEGAAEDKGKAQCSNIAYGKTEDNNSLASIEDCLALHFKSELLGWTCENCSKAAHHPSNTSSKDGEKMMATTRQNRVIDGDQTEHLVVQEAVPSCLPTEEPANHLSDQGQNASTLVQCNGKQVKLDHRADQVEANQKKREDRNQGANQIRLFSKLPPVLAIHLKRSLLTGKVRGHVSFEEILDVGRFMDPSSQDKDNSSYLLVGVIEHLGPRTSAGHWIAYVRQSREQPDGGSSSWFCANDMNIREVSLEQVLKCEGQHFFYERIGG